MNFKSLTAPALAALVLAPLTPAQAADYDPPIYVDQAPDYQPVEVGSGWYLRGDVGYAGSRRATRIEDFTFTPASFSEKQDPAFASIGFGYHFNDYLRGDINLGYLPGNKIGVGFDDLRRPPLAGRSRPSRRHRCRIMPLVSAWSMAMSTLALMSASRPMSAPASASSAANTELSAKLSSADNADRYAMISSGTTTRRQYSPRLFAGCGPCLSGDQECFRRSRLPILLGAGCRICHGREPDLLSSPQGHQQSSGQARAALRSLVGWPQIRNPTADLFDPPFAFGLTTS